MPHRGYLRIGQTELANTRRTVSYLENGVRNVSTEVVTDDSWPMLPWYLGRDDEWTTPAEDDDCPWYDPTESASAEFAGVWLMRVDGLDADPTEREVIEAATDGGGFGPLRTPPRTIEVEALLLAQTPAGLQFGMGWLNSVLRDREPRALTFLASAPPFDAEMTPDDVVLLGLAETRMVSSVVLTGEITVEETTSPWVPENRGATMARVSFELTAGVPWVWRMPQSLVTGLQPYNGEPETVTFDNSDPPEMIAATGGVLHDPATSPMVTLPRPVTPAAALGLYPLESKRLLWQLDAGRLSPWFDAFPTITIRTGPQAERAVRVQWVEGVPQPGADIPRIAIGEALIRYIPPSSTFTLDAVTGRAEVVTADGRMLDATPVTTGRQGGPWRAPQLHGDRTYTLVIDAMDTVHQQVVVDVAAMVRRP